MASPFEPTTIAISALNTNYASSVRYLTAAAFQNNLGTGLTAISSNYILRWNVDSIALTGYNLTVAYITGGTIASLTSYPVSYNVSNLVIDLPNRYSTVNVNNPFTVNFYKLSSTSYTSSNLVPKNTDVLSQAASSIVVQFSANYVNRTPFNLSISSIAFNNEPFIRTLTASIMQNNPDTGYVLAGGPGTLKWEFDSTNIWAKTISGSAYNTGTLAPASAINTLVFYITADTYDYLTTDYTLLTSTLSAFFLSGSPLQQISYNKYDVVYDTFPNVIPADLYVNYENTKNNSIFYRLTSLTPYTFTLSSTSSVYDTNTSDYYYRVFYTVNGSGSYTDTNSLTSFNSTIPSVCSIQVNVSAVSAINSFNSWYTPHIITGSISAVFLREYPVANFIGYPTLYFVDYQTQVTLTSSNFTSSPGIRFYGEGHTEKINLSAQSGTNITSYNWLVGTLETQSYSVTGNRLATVNIQTTVGNYPTIPISLFVTNNDIKTTGPIEYFDDTTGARNYYPFYSSTVNVDGVEDSNNTYLKESIHVLSYTQPVSSFTPGISGSIFLPQNRTTQAFTGSLRVVLSGQNDSSLLPCYDKYGLTWNWAAFENCATNPNSFIGRPSSWGTVECSGTFPKKWRNEGALSATSYTQTPVFCTGSNFIWTLSTANWSVINSNPGTLNTYNYTLRYSDEGTAPFTVSEFENTPIYIEGTQTVTCLICAFPYDWLPREIIYKGTSLATVQQPVDLRIYTPNRYVLTGTDIKFENVSVNTSFIKQIDFNFDELQTITLTGNDVTKNVTVQYNTPGSKSLTVTTYYTTSQEPTTTVFSDIITVVETYDVVDFLNYRTNNTPLSLPWNTAPYIAPNEWAVEDNINAVIRKFYDNLNYLESRSRSYINTPPEFFGWLGNPPSLACPTWTWEDLDCLAGGRDVSWEDVQIIDPAYPEITETGSLSACGFWLQQECTQAVQNPTCLGRHCVDWYWSARKSAGNPTPITWAMTKTDGGYEKKWLYEPCVTSTGEVVVGAVCNQGIWNVNIPALNDYYDPIVNCTDNNIQCKYRGIASRNNMLYVALGTEIRALSSDYSAKFISKKQTVDDISIFKDIKGIAINSESNIYVLDGTLNKVGVYTFDPQGIVKWSTFTVWGGFGTSNSPTRFSKPNDIHIDQFDNVWVSDTGNRCIKQYTNSGSWLQTVKDDAFEINAPLSVAVTSDSKIHVLTNNSIRVYSYTGIFEFEYSFANINSSTSPLKINTNYNREIVYIVYSNQVHKFFRNGVYNGVVVVDKPCANDIQSIYQDEFRNILITTSDKILKFPDVMKTTLLKGPLPNSYWKLNDLLVHKNEYIQNWVYNKSFQRLWDNIEIFRHSLIFTSNGCKSYKPYKYSKEKILIGQNEIVTSTVINRIIGYLWENFITMLDYFDPSCKN